MDVIRTLMICLTAFSPDCPIRSTFWHAILRSTAVCWNPDPAGQVLKAQIKGSPTKQASEAKIHDFTGDNNSEYVANEAKSDLDSADLPDDHVLIVVGNKGQSVDRARFLGGPKESAGFVENLANAGTVGFLQN
ncbi:MAG: hypothetical protein ABJZ55_01460 [Fuerstiella sp.]